MSLDWVKVSDIREKKIVVFGAHSDDAEFLAGGTLLHLGKQKYKNKIISVVVTDGRMGSHEFEYDGNSYVQARSNEAKKAAENFGADLSFWSYPDLGLIERKRHLLIRIVKFLLKERPDIVISFDPWGMYELYIHPDHRVLAWVVIEALLVATLPRWVQKHGLGRRKLDHKPECWLMQPATPNVLVDVSDVWNEKVGLMEHFTSQFDEHFQWEKVVTWVSKQAQFLGEPYGVAFAEGFRIIEYDGKWGAAK